MYIYVIVLEVPFLNRTCTYLHYSTVWVCANSGCCAGSSESSLVAYTISTVVTGPDKITSIIMVVDTFSILHKNVGHSRLSDIQEGAL